MMQAGTLTLHLSYEAKTTSIFTGACCLVTPFDILDLEALC